MKAIHFFHLILNAIVTTHCGEFFEYDCYEIPLDQMPEK